MTLQKATLATLAIAGFCILFSSCGPGGPPTPGREIVLDEGVTLTLIEGWEAEVVGTDWAMWRRVQRGRGEQPWVIPPITATNVAGGTFGYDRRKMYWRFKGVEGVFDPTVNPLTDAYPVPEGLWSLDPQKLELEWDHTRVLPWEGVSEIEATVRQYENTHGFGELSQLWHTQVVTFVVGANTYEFVLAIPDSADQRDWKEQFWGSIESLTIE